MEKLLMAGAIAAGVVLVLAPICIPILKQREQNSFWETVILIRFAISMSYTALPVCTTTTPSLLTQGKREL